MVWDNPSPVAVLLVPVRHEDSEGVMVIRRGIDPEKGKLALVGGFLEAHETWQAGGAREVLEETGIEVDPGSIEQTWVASSDPKPNRILIFATCAPVDASTFEPFEESAETTERGVVFGPDGLDEVFGFSLHAEALRRFFAARGASGPHGYTQL